MVGRRAERSASPRDVRPSDVGLGVLVAVAVAIASAGILHAAQSSRRADVPPIDPGAGVPIAVRPVLDAPAAGKGRKGKGKGSRVPKHWQRADPAAVAAATAAVAAEAPVESPVSDDPSAIAIAEDPKSPTTPRAVSKRPTLLGLPSLDDPDEPAEATDGGEPSDTDGGPPGDPNGDPEAPAEGDGGGGGEGETEGPAGDPSGDAAGERAVALYRERLSRWLSARFTVTGSGLSKEQLRKHKVRAVVRLDADGNVVDFDVIASGNAAFDEGARAALESVRGEAVPSPPEDYPGALQSEIRVTFVCKESRCD